ncbi:hypothetical protein H4S02_006692, partial [Coemansia sp. RSA 2611]
MGSGVYAGDRRSYVRRGRGSPPMSRQHARPYRGDPSESYHDYHRRSPLMHVRRSIDRDGGGYGSRSSMRRKPSVRSVPRAPSFGRRPRYAGSYVSSMPPPQSPLAVHSAGLSEKHTPPPYDAAYDPMLDEDEEDELVAMERARHIRRLLKYGAYALVAALLVLTCALLAYFLSPRAPVVALHAINSPESMSSSKFKLQGTKLQFHMDLIYRVQNDNFFDMSVSDISTAVFWPDTQFALGGGRLSDVRIPARRTVQLTMPIALKYDVKRGPPPILLGMVESC